MDRFKSFRLYDYNVYDGQNKHEIESNKLLNIRVNNYKDNKKFIIQAFGINDSNKSASILIENFYPFFYILVSEEWSEQRKNLFLAHLKKKVGNYYEDSIVSLLLVKRQKLYGFDNKKLHNFIKISFMNNAVYNKVKKLFYTDTTNKYTGFERSLNDDGYIYEDEYGITNCHLYEADIPPLLKFFHEKEITPSGWIKMPSNKVRKITNKTTHCAYEYCINYEDITAYKDKETLVKYNICSFDIEASSSHGDFPLPIKNYKKLATNILENYYSCDDETKNNYDISMLKQEILSAFDLETNKLSYIARVYPKEKNLDAINFDNLIDNLSNYIPADFKKKNNDENVVEMSDSDDEDEDEDDDEENALDDVKDCENTETCPNFKRKKRVKGYYKKNVTLIELIKDNTCEYNTKLLELIEAFNNTGFPELEGDIITFIGLSFINYTEACPYKRVIIVKGGCKIPDKYLSWVQENNVIVLERSSEKDVLITFTKIIIAENPHVITGYNITGFDFEFMYKRSLELKCVKEFLKLSRNKDEICISKDWRTGSEDIETNKIILASGEYNLKFIKMPGRIIIDMYVIFRKEFTLSSNKLDFTSSYFISDNVLTIHVNKEENSTKVNSKNLTGLAVGSYIKFDELGFSSNLYKKGKKFEIISINKEEQWFIINSAEELDLVNYKYKWGLAKDDVSPQEIFSLANGSDYDRWTVGKYCLADCDNVIWLLLKVDVITDKVEMSNLCNVPLSFLLLRGQGIKLQSYVSKKCGEKNTLMPVIKKQSMGGGYEGAHVFKPKTGIYLDEPVACVDYSSLYPSSIISENLSHDSKVWTKEYDLSGNLIQETGEKDEKGDYFIYDNLHNQGYNYVDVKYDTYKYVRLTPKAAAKKVIMGYKICRFAQFPDGKAIMPSILEDLLSARKATRKLILLENDEFMKNVLDKRQLSIKVTANSLYGQMGAVTSAFYEPDVAASTTANGRKLLFYGRSIIEECYNNIDIKVKDGSIVRVKAECVYGDTDSVFFKFNLRNPETNEKIVNKEALVYTIELAKQAGELASKFLKAPHDLEYEKTFYPWILLSKKRYVGILYEDNPDKGKMKYMGIVLKRRDNAPIVKDIYGGIVNIIMSEKSISKSIKFLNECLEKLMLCEYPIEKLLVTKSLRGYYKNPKQIAHKVLAERIGLRDSGNKPSTGDRMYYAYIVNSNKKALQGEKIETPDYIKERGLPIDYSHYISNQIMKPLLQLYALDLENMNEFKKKRGITLQSWYNELARLKEKWVEPEKYEKKLEELKCKEVKSLLFDKFLKECK